MVVLRDVIIDEMNTFGRPEEQEKLPDVARIERDDVNSEFDDSTDDCQDKLDVSIDHYVDCDEVSEDFDSAGASGGHTDSENEPREVDPLKIEQTDRNVRKREPPMWHKDYDMGCAYALSAMNFVESFPDTLEEMKKRDDWPQWKIAIEEEKKSHQKNATWTLCKLPEGKKTVSCK